MADYDFHLQPNGEQDLKGMVNSGLMSQKDYERAVVMKQEMDEENLGYGFVTFSHADEARLQLLQTKNKINLYGLAEV